MSTIYVVTGDKGGVGKTTVATGLLDKSMAEGCDLILIEADQRNPDVLDRFQGHFDHEHLDLLDHAGWIQLSTIVAKNPDRDILISMPAQIGLRNDEFSFLDKALKRSGHKLIVVWVMNRSADSVTLLRDFALATKGIDRKIVVVRNGFFGDAAKFYRWENADFRESMLAAGHYDIFIPELHEMVIDAVPLDQPLSLSVKNEELDFGIQAELENWLTDVYTAFRVFDEDAGQNEEVA